MNPFRQKQGILLLFVNVSMKARIENNKEIVFQETIKVLRSSAKY